MLPPAATIVLAALPLQVTVSLPAAGKAQVHVQVEARRSEGFDTSGDSGSVVRRLTLEQDAPGLLEMQLDEGVWRLEARAPDHWCPPVMVRVPEDGTAVALRLWATVPVPVSLEIEKGAETPVQLRVQFRRDPGAPAAQGPPQGIRECPVKGRVGVCDLPVARLDLRLEARGFVPVYVWSFQAADSGRTALGPVHLRTGASITGFVRTEQGEPAKDAVIEALTPSSRQRIESRKRATRKQPAASDADRARYPLQDRANARGFFQITGVQAGEYELGARSGATQASASVRVEPGAETRLPDFLILEPPLQLEVTLEPATAPGGETWSIRLLRFEPFPGLVQQRNVSASGAATLAPVGKGRYSIEVWKGGERWYVHTLTIEGPPGPVQIRLPIVQVRGELTLAGKPLSGQVVFGGRNGPQEIAMDADSEGRFAGSLPNAGAWTVGVEAAEPAVNRCLRRVEVQPDASGEASITIDLPDTVLSGRVVDEQGVGVRALLDVKPQTADDRLFQLHTEADGRFVLHGLAEGVVTLAAHDPQGRSAVLSTRTVKDGEVDATLVLRSELRVKGRVRSASGMPLPGATLLAFPWGVHSIGSRYYTSDTEGSFELMLPPGTREVSVFCWADGHVQQFLRLPVTSEPLALTLDSVGGTLVLDFGREFDLFDVFREADSIPVVAHGGAQASAGQLYSHVLRRGVMLAAPVSQAQASVALPQMAPGEYWLCTQTAAELLANLPVRDPCERGTLTAGGELHLKLPAKSADRQH